MQKGVACGCWQNEFLFKEAAVCTIFWAILSRIWCYLLQNGVQYAAKRSAFWCKMACVLVQNGVRFGAKRKVKCSKMQCKMVLNARR